MAKFSRRLDIISWVVKGPNVKFRGDLRSELLLGKKVTAKDALTIYLNRSLNFDVLKADEQIGKTRDVYTFRVGKATEGGEYEVALITALTYKVNDMEKEDA